MYPLLSQVVFFILILVGLAACSDDNNFEGGISATTSSGTSAPDTPDGVTAITCGTTPWGNALDAVNNRRSVGSTCGGTVYAPNSQGYAWQKTLCDVARGHAIDMAAAKAVSHTRTDLETRLVAAGYNFADAGRSVASTTSSSSSGFVTKLERSQNPTDCDNIYDNDGTFTEMAIGRAKDTVNGVYYWSFIVAKPR